MRLAGVDHIHAGTVVGELEGDPNATAGYYDTCREIKQPRNPVKGIFFDPDWVSMPGVMPVASGGIHAAQMGDLLQSSARMWCCSSVAARSATRWYLRRRHRQPGCAGGDHQGPE
jgi:ribulose 1,5-bisphosphate carboxylase large subunit-like protein